MAAGEAYGDVTPDGTLLTSTPLTLPMSLLTTALWLSLWVAGGSLALAIADGLGAQPARRVGVGLVLVASTAAALWQRERVCSTLRTRPWLILLVAAAQLIVVAIDGLVGGPYVAFTLTSIGVAAIVAAPRTVWWCVALLDLGYAVGVSLEYAPAELAQRGDLAGVVGQLLGYPFAALSLLGLAVLFKRFETHVGVLLDSLRHGAPALTPALTQAIQRPRQPLLLSPWRPTIRLTASEIKVVEGLARGYAPKELAHQWGVSLATVRTHIKHAKRKTGARTLPKLAALVADPDWPALNGDAD